MSNNRERNRILRRAVEHIKAEPKRLNMGTWLSPSNTSPCGTVGCLFGWVVMLEEPKHQNATIYSSAQELLQLDDLQAGNLALVGYWPKPLRVKYRNRGNTPRQRANILGQRVEHFIRTGE